MKFLANRRDSRIRTAEWYVLSARKAFILLHSLLIERVYALRVRNFTQAFRGAEVDMHFSLKKDPAAQFADNEAWHKGWS